MHNPQWRAACLMAALILAAATAHAAPGIVLKNEMELGIKAVYCADDAGRATRAAAALPGGATLALSPDKFPERGCKRIAVHADNDAAWQFYLDQEPGAAGEIVFAMDKANPNAEESYPSLLLELADGAHVFPAGVPLALLTGSMLFGMDAKKWKELDTPDYDSLQSSDTFAVSFAGVSWRLTGLDGIVFAELVPGMELAESVTLSTSFSNATVAAIFEGLKALRGTPVLLLMDDRLTALNEEGKAMAPQAGTAGNTPTDESRWQAVDDLMKRAADGGEVGVTFASEDLVFELLLHLDDATATLIVTRKTEAAFGQVRDMAAPRLAGANAHPAGSTYPRK